MDRAKRTIDQFQEFILLGRAQFFLLLFIALSPRNQSNDQLSWQQCLNVDNCFGKKKMFQRGFKFWHTFFLLYYNLVFLYLYFWSLICNPSFVGIVQTVENWSVTRDCDLRRMVNPGGKDLVIAHACIREQKPRSIYYINDDVIEQVLNNTINYKKYINISK